MLRCPDCWRGFATRVAKDGHYCTGSPPAGTLKDAYRVRLWRWGADPWKWPDPLRQGLHAEGERLVGFTRNLP